MRKLTSLALAAFAALALGAPAVADGPFGSPQSPPLPSKAAPYKAAPSPQFSTPAPAPAPSAAYRGEAYEETAPDTVVVYRAAPRVRRYTTVVTEAAEPAPCAAPAQNFGAPQAAVVPCGGFGRGFGAGGCNGNNAGPNFGGGFGTGYRGNFGADPGFSGGGGSVTINARKIKKSFRGGFGSGGGFGAGFGGGNVTINARKVKKSF